MLNPFLKARTGDRAMIISNIWWGIMEKMILLFSGIFVYARIASYLGPSGFGYYNYVISLYVIFLPLASLGLSNIIVSKFLEQGADRDKLMGTSAVIRFIGSLLAIIANAVFIYVLTKDPYLVTLSLLMSWSYLFTIFQVIDEYFQANLQAKAISMVRMVVYIILIVIKLLAIKYQQSISVFILIYAAEFFLTSIGLILLYRKEGNQIRNWRFDPKLARQLFVLFLPILITVIADTVAARYAVVVINQYLDISQVGIYAVAAKLGEVWYFVPTTLCVAIYPKVAKLFNESDRGYRVAVASVYSVLFLIAVGVLVSANILSEPFIPIIFDKNYLSAVPLLNIYVVTGIFISLRTFSQRLYILEGVQKYLIPFSILSSITTITLLYLLVPQFGAIGAIWGMIAGHLSYTFLFPLLFRDSRRQVGYILEGIAPWNYLRAKRLFLK